MPIRPSDLPRRLKCSAPSDSAARVHALALKFAAEAVSRRGDAGLSLHKKLRDRTAALLLQSARQLPRDKQARFWRDIVAADPLLRPFGPQ